MKSTIRTIAAVAFSLILTGSSQADEERREVEPSLQGIWRLHSFSKDEGLNMESMANNTLVRVSAAEMRFPDGKRCAVQRVRLFTDDQGHPVEWIFLSDGEVLEVTRDPGQPTVHVKVLMLDNDQVVEAFRFEMTVDNLTVKNPTPRLEL